MPRPRRCLASLVLLVLALVAPRAGYSQGLPELAPINPVATARSGLYFQPFRDPAPGRWTTRLALDYASVIEYNRPPQADYVLDAEVMRFSLELAHDLTPHTFIALTSSVEGAYAGFMDGFLDWYHGLLGITISEREKRPPDQFLYTITLPDGAGVSRARSNLFLQDLRVGLGIRYTPRLQSVISLTLPTSTGPEGYGKGVVSVAILNTFRAPLGSRVTYEGSLGLGFTPTHGSLPQSQRETFAAASSGLRARVWGRQSLFANLFYHSPYYHDTTLPALDRKELSLDFGWILRTHRGGEWRVGMTEDLEPAGPAVDLVFRFAGSF
ncbi:MAG TPA: DUF3187 family protein [Gemmatimonadales bacterium]|nr:DUF3187 family protein [Gemmatimonadales bacterium]